MNKSALFYQVLAVIVCILVIGLAFWAVKKLTTGEPQKLAATAETEQQDEQVYTVEEGKVSPVQRASSWFSVMWVFIVLFFLLGIVFLLYSHKLERDREMVKEDDPEKEAKRARLRFRQTIFHEVGMAMIVACVISTTFEVTVRKQERVEQEESIKLMHKDLFRYLLGHSVDSKLMSELYQSVFRSSFVRRNMKVTCELSSLKGKHAAGDKGEKFIHFRTTVSYHMRNITGDRQKYLFNPTLTNTCQCEDEKDSVSDLRVTDETGKTVIKLSNSDLALVQNGMVSKLKTIPCVIVPEGREVEIKYAYNSVKRYSDMITWQTLHPTDGISFRIILGDDGVSNLVVHADSAHRAYPVLASIREDGCKFYEWTIQNYLLPGQGIELYWRPNSIRENPAAVGKKRE
jgi:hypothetical protein